MTSITARAERATVMLMILTAAVFLAGCTSPPSVAPLLHITERALLEESARLDQDTERDRLYVRQTLGSLEDAYYRDLDETDQLTPEWVRGATSIYVIAREAVIEHEASLTHERGVRAENLRNAATATRRAIALIEQQDQLLRGVVGDDLRHLLEELDDWRKDPIQ
jgi:hypothetical protein